MQIIPIAPIPNQTLSVVLENNFYQIQLQQVAGIVSATIVMNASTVISGQRCVGGSLIIPYLYLQSGNFFFQTANLDLPSYDQFNITQNLVYISIADIQQIMAVPQSFQQYGMLPLRYSGPAFS